MLRRHVQVTFDRLLWGSMSSALIQRLRAKHSVRLFLVRAARAYVCVYVCEGTCMRVNVCVCA